MTNKKTEALKLALEALEEIHPGNMTPIAEEAWNKAITTIREALAEQPAQQQEPIKWSSHEPDGTYHNKSTHQQEVVDEYGVCSGCGMKYCECGEQDE